MFSSCRQKNKDSGFFKTKEDSEMNRAIELSLTEQSLQKNPQLTYEPLNPELRVRPPGLPIGLKNVGNSELFSIILLIRY